MPAESWRMYPARSKSWWLTTSASAGFSRRVGINNWLQSIDKLSGKPNSSMLRLSVFPMKIAIAADHGGFILKEKLRCQLAGSGHTVVDFGTDSTASCDYPDFAHSVAEAVSEGRADRGILLCTTGIG